MRVIKCIGFRMRRLGIRKRRMRIAKEGSFVEVYEQFMRRIRKVNQLKVN